MAMPLDYTPPLYEIIQNYFLNVTLMAARGCFKPLLNDYNVSTDDKGWVLISGTHNLRPLRISLITEMSDKVNYYRVRGIVKWPNEPNHAPFDMSFESHLVKHPIMKFDAIRSALVEALQVKE
jgi:hypothetical protein